MLGPYLCMCIYIYELNVYYILYKYVCLYIYIYIILIMSVYCVQGTLLFLLFFPIGLKGKRHQQEKRLPFPLAFRTNRLPHLQHSASTGGCAALSRPFLPSYRNNMSFQLFLRLGGSYWVPLADLHTDLKWTDIN